jgi:DNA-binding CsgD family transcriptional regulator
MGRTMKIESFEQWNRSVLLLLQQQGKPSFITALKQALDLFLSRWQLIAWYYPFAGQAVPLHELGDSATLQQDVERYRSGPYLLDPFYLAGSAAKTGCCSLAELAPSGFKQSEYYRSYYRFLGCADELGLLAATDLGFYNISLCRDRGQARFSKSERQAIQAVFPLLESLCSMHLKMLNGPDVKTETIYPQLARALGHFATSVLTPREAEVVQLLLKGHSTQSAADKLGISPQTIKLHRKNSYSKLDVRSQAELFYLFIDSLSCVEQVEGGDTLAVYLSRSPESQCL